MVQVKWNKLRKESQQQLEIDNHPKTMSYLNLKRCNPILPITLKRPSQLEVESSFESPNGNTPSVADHGADKHRCICRSPGYKEYYTESSLPCPRETRYPRVGGRGWSPTPRRATTRRADALQRQRPRTPGCQHQLKAVKVNEGGHGA